MRRARRGYHPSVRSGRLPVQRPNRRRLHFPFHVASLHARTPHFTTTLTLL